MATLDVIAPALDADTVAVAPESPARAEAAVLNARYRGRKATEIIDAAVNELFPGRVAMVSSFGAESAVLLHLLAAVDPGVPVIFINTGRLFPETLDYREKLAEKLGLTDIRNVGPEPSRVAELDPLKALWMTDPDLCCHMRKTEPLARGLAGFDAWFTGRKRFQSAKRARLDFFEPDGPRLKVNPLAEWSPADLLEYASIHDLPPHPLTAKGYPSIGCVPCTTKVLPGEDQRAGRWRGLSKTECGIHADLESNGSGI
ncbi:MAG: phosphoadenylyl-sulfate reductase [Bauldia sp.]|nr:phosphoadenylyl-sulfate reductase [Bauldia sp.]